MKPLNNRGISLIEVLVASSIMGLISLALIQQFDMQRKMLNTMEAGFDTIDAVNQLRTVLSEGESCKKTFETTLLSPAGATKNQIQQAFKNALGVWQYNVAFDVATPFNPQIQFKSFTLKGTNPSNGKAHLSVEIERLRPGIMGSSQVIRDVELFVNVDAANKIVDCYAAGGSGGGGGGNYYTKTELAGIRPSTATPIHRSWLADAWFDPNMGTVSPNNAPSRSTLVSVCGTPITVLSKVIPDAGYDRIIEVNASIFAIKDSGADDVMAGEMSLNGFYSERTTVSLDAWSSENMRLNGIYKQLAGQPVTVEIKLQNTYGTCNNYDQNHIHMFVKEL